MYSWPAFQHNGKTYSLSHLDSKVITITRAATEKCSEQKLKAFLTYGDHCFTNHHGQGDDWIYRESEGRKERYFCLDRYEYSKALPTLIPSLIADNPYIQRIITRHRREQFYYLETHLLDVNYRLFLEFSKSNHPDSDIRIKAISAYEEASWAESVGKGDHFKVWSVIDARINGRQLESKSRRGRRK